MNHRLALSLVLSTTLLGAALATPLVLDPQGDAEADVVAISGTGDAVAATGCEYAPLPVGVAACPAGGAVSGVGDATACGSAYLCAGAAASGTGDASACVTENGFYPTCAGAAASGTGDAAGTLAASAFGDATAASAAASGTGDAAAPVAATLFGNATSCPGEETYYGSQCAALAASGTGDSFACGGSVVAGYGCTGVAASGTGDATACPNDEGSGYPTTGFTCLGVALSGTGEANGCSEDAGSDCISVAVSGCDATPVLCGGVHTIRATLPTNVSFAPDADGDGVPRSVRVEMSDATVTLPSGDTTIARNPAADLVVPLDPNDANPDSPVPRRTTVPIATGVVVGEDADGDGFPRSIAISRGEIVIEPGAEEPVRLRSAGPAVFTLVTDANDANPDVPVARRVSVTVPTGVALGPDADGDAVPAFLATTTTRVTIDRESGSVTLEEGPGGAPAPLDPNDANPSVPAPQRVSAEVPAGVAFGPDADGDGFPATAAVSRARVTLDRTTGNVTVQPLAPLATVALDPADGDPNRPVLSRITVALPAGLVVGADADGDGVPASVATATTRVTVDRRTGDVITEPGPTGASVALDPNDANPETPAPTRRTVTLPTGLVLGPDADGDGVPSYVATSTTRVTVDRSVPSLETEPGAPANQARLDPNDADASNPVPPRFGVTAPSNVTLGPDADGDGVPAFARIEQSRVIVDRATGAVSVERAPASDVTVPLDPNDANADAPAPRRLSATVPTGVAAGPDEDADGVPSTIALTATRVTVDRATGDVTMEPAPAGAPTRLDPNDHDANVPIASVASATVPSGVAVGPDADGDGLPAHATIEMTRVTIDRRAPDVTLERDPAADRRVGVDPDDANPQLTPLAGASATGDAQGQHLAASGTGDATCTSALACLAVSGTGDASACMSTLTCAGASGAGDATGYLAASGAGDATACRLRFLCAAASGTGTADGGDFAASALGDAASDRLALSGAGDAAGAVPLTALGACNGEACFAAGPEGASAWWAAIAAGNANGLVAASSGGSAAGGLVAVGGAHASGGLVGASAGDASGGLVAVSASGDASAGLVAIAPAGEADGAIEA